MRHVPGTLLVLLGLAACGGSATEPDEDTGKLSGGELTATAITMEAPPAGVVQVRFENTGLERYRFNPCERRVERQTAGGWVALPPELRLCSDEVFALEARSASLYGSDVPADAGAGMHRFVFPVTQEAADGQRVLVVSTPFNVVR